MMHWLHRMARTVIGAIWALRRARPRRARVGLELEGLETRRALSAGGGVPFASMPGRIDKAGHAATLVFRLEPGRFLSDRSIPLLLGLDAEPVPGSTVDPKVVRIVGLDGRSTTGIATRGGPLVTHVALPVLKPSVYEIKVVGRHGTTGTFTINAFLPGDVNGDGVVDRVDLARVRFGYGSHAGGPRYTPAADFNNDGKIGHTDFGLTKRNLGSSVKVVALSSGTSTEGRA
jgi:hypothetical protein